MQTGNISGRGQGRLILGIETSCDETAAAVVRSGRETLSNVVASQIALHADYGGVVPELASREHLRAIVPVVRAAVREAGLNLADLDAIAVTAGPGLAGALLVGITYAQALAFGLGKPLLAVNHLEGHIHAALLDARARGDAPLPMPILALVVSGGHTHLYRATEDASGSWAYQSVGRTVDDAAGEAYDKVAKLLGFGYPGGPWLDRLAPFGDPGAVRFQFNPIRRRDTPAGQPGFDLSFSGIKTAVLRYVELHGMRESIAARRAVLAAQPDICNWTPEQAASLCDAETLGLIASFQAAVVGILLRRTFDAAQHFGARGVLVSGGVAANRELRRRFTGEAARRGLPLVYPSVSLSTDNAAMIAAAADPLLRAGRFAPEVLSASPRLALGSTG